MSRTRTGVGTATPAPSATRMTDSVMMSRPGSLAHLYEKVELNRGDLRMMLAVAAHEGRTTDEAGFHIADTLIEVARTRHTCPTCRSLPIPD